MSQGTGKFVMSSDLLGWVRMGCAGCADAKKSFGESPCYECRVFVTAPSHFTVAHDPPRAETPFNAPAPVPPPDESPPAPMTYPAIRLWACSVCGKQAKRCEHKDGQVYDGVLCMMMLQEIGR